VKVACTSVHNQPLCYKGGSGRDKVKLRKLKFVYTKILFPRKHCTLIELLNILL
jgi:hypothetical protein